MVGFLGDSERDGVRRMYFNRDLDYYAEFRTDDVLSMEPKPAYSPPFAGDEATWVRLRRDAKVEYTRVRTGRPVDEYDLDIRMADEAVVKAQGGTCTHVFLTTCGVSPPTMCGGTDCGYCTM